MRKLLSVIIPVLNEAENVEKLHDEIVVTLSEMLKTKMISDYEIIFVNDGSRDQTQKELESLKKGKRLRIIQLRKNFGQTPALKAGFDLAKGDFIVTMDGDLQNDPKDIPRLLDKLNQGYDVVSGWRFRRKDKFTKRIASRMMNNLRYMIIGDRLHDYGCSLKMYKRECIQDLELYGELHRFITAYLYIKGYRIGEVKVNHRQRKFGKTKYNYKRGLNGVLDLLYLKFWASYSDRPLHFFGRIGVFQWVISVLIVTEQIIKAILVKELRFGPLLALASMLVITGMLSVMFGFLFEIITRGYYKEKKMYSVRKIL